MKHDKVVSLLIDCGFALSQVRRALLALTGVTQQEIALKSGYSKSLVAMAINQEAGSGHIKKFIARCLNVNPNLIFKNIN